MFYRISSYKNKVLPGLQPNLSQVSVPSFVGQPGQSTCRGFVDMTCSDKSAIFFCLVNFPQRQSTPLFEAHSSLPCFPSAQRTAVPAP